jgi:beta-lactam-binding protein with PASTA domain
MWQKGWTIFKIVHKSGINRIRSLIWILPFGVFLGGYFLTGFFLYKTDLTAPNIIGKSVHSAVQILSQQHLGMRLLQQKEDQALPEGTIIDQLPRPLQTIRPNQNVFVVVSTRQKAIIMPDFWKYKQEEVRDLITKNGLNVTACSVFSNYPMGMCVAQFPMAGQELLSKKVTLYFSSGKNLLSIMPNLKDRPLVEVLDALRQFDVRAEVFHTNPVEPEHHCQQCKIIDQQPAAGAMVDLSRSLRIQLQVSQSA